MRASGRRSGGGVVTLVGKGSRGEDGPGGLYGGSGLRSTLHPITEGLSQGHSHQVRVERGGTDHVLSERVR